MRKYAALFVLLTLATATPAAAQSCNVIGNTILCASGWSVRTNGIQNFHDPSGAEAGNRALLAGAQSARIRASAAAMTLETQRKAAAYNALYRYCGALAYYGPQCLSMVHTRRPRSYDRKSVQAYRSHPHDDNYGTGVDRYPYSRGTTRAVQR